jgi:hypothetical protein
MDNEQPQPDDQLGVIVIGHLLIRDADTQEVLVNQRGSAKNVEKEDDN